MNITQDEGIRIISGFTQLTPVDAGEFSQIDIQGMMKFNTSQYDINGLGNLSVMTSGMAGMQMLSVVITPFEKNMPLLSIDYIINKEDVKAIVEFYDLVADKNTAEYSGVLDAVKGLESRYSGLEDIITERTWHNDLMTVSLHKTGKTADEQFEKLFCDTLRCYMEMASELPVLSADEKAEKLALTLEYTDSLISKGGVSTDVFKKVLGEEKTKKFFGKVFFGTESRK